jgi:hypothetical protein
MILIGWSSWPSQVDLFTGHPLVLFEPMALLTRDFYHFHAGFPQVAGLEFLVRVCLT